MPNLIFTLNEKPDGFTPTFETSAVFIEVDDEILMMHRHPEKSYGLTWGLPAGKLEEGETPLQAAVREVLEETGILLDPSTLDEIGSMHIQERGFDFSFHMFFISLKESPAIRIEDSAHIDWQFIKPEKARSLPLILGGPECIDLFLTYKSKRLK